MNLCSLTQQTLHMIYGNEANPGKYDVLTVVDKYLPWEKLLDYLAPHYYARTSCKGGRPRLPLVIQLRIYIYARLKNRTDVQMVKDLDYTPECYNFCHHNPAVYKPPHRTTIGGFRLSIERGEHAEKIFDIIFEHLMHNPILVAHLQENGLFPHKATIVDSTFIDAPTSTKNKEGSRNPEMSWGKKGSQCHFGLKLHVGIDWDVGMVHSLHVTPANVADISVVPELLHGEEVMVIADAGYVGVGKRPENEHRKVVWLVTQRPSSAPNGKYANNPFKYQRHEIRKKIMRAKVEHIFLTIKKHFGFDKTTLRTMKQNMSRLYVLTALANIVKFDQYMRRKKLA